MEVCPLDVARDQFEVMFWGPVHICKEVSGGSLKKKFWLTLFNNDLQAVRIFREVNPPGDGGHIFNVSSAGGYFAQPSIPYYAAAKFGNAFSDLIYLQLLTRFFFPAL